MTELATGREEYSGFPDSPHSPDERRRYAAKVAERARLREIVSGDEGAEAIVSQLATHISGGVPVSRICAEAESGITRIELEALLNERALDRGRPLGSWWDHDDALRHLAALKTWLDEEAKASNGDEEFAPTATFDRVYGLLGLAHKTRSMVAITGMYGIGKSFAARRYAFDHPRRPNEPGAVWFEFPPGTRGDVGVLDAVLTALEPYTEPRGNLNVKRDRILDILKPGDFLIADECGIPADKGTGLRFMAYFNEQARIPVAMIGNPSFHAAVWGRRTEYDALANRARHVSLQRNGEEDVDAFMEWRRLSGREWRSALITVVQLPGRDGGLRGAVAMLDELESRGADVTPESFKELAKTYGRYPL